MGKIPCVRFPVVRRTHCRRLPGTTLLSVTKYYPHLYSAAHMTARTGRCRVAGVGRTRPALMKFTWNGDMPYSSVEWGLAFPVRAICLHRERDSASQVSVEGLPVPGDFHGRGIDEKMRTGTAAGKYAGRLLKASYAAQPKGCSACFVPRRPAKNCKSTWIFR